MENIDVECASTSDLIVQKEKLSNRDDYGRLYGRSRKSKKYQTACPRLSRRKWRINKRYVIYIL